MKKKLIYVKCPRCDLNYIDKKQKMCEICKAELNLVSPSILIPDEDEEEERLCPVCHETFITAEESMCFECSKDKHDVGEDEENAEEDWEYVAEVVDEPLPVEDIGIDLSDEIDEEDLDDDILEAEEFESDFEDDFDTDLDDDAFDDLDLDDDEEEEDDEDDEDF